MHVYKFRDCLLNTAERSVIKEHQHLELTTKTFDVLQYLIENAGKVVSKDDILGNVWNGNFVEESNLPVHISKLRRSLSESRDCRFIETVQGTGYRFVAPLQTVTEEVWHVVAEASRHRSSSKTLEFEHSIAVLPLHNESHDPNVEYLAEGLTEGIINALSHISGLKVIARDTVFRYRGAEAEAIEIGETLGVETIFAGRIRVIDNRLIVGVELISVRDRRQLWGDRYDRQFSEIFALQDDISFRIRERLELTNHNQKRILYHSFTHGESYRLYLKGKYFLEKRSAENMYRAINFFTESVHLDSTNIHSYIETVECYRLLYVFDYISHKEFRQRIKPILAVLEGASQPSDLLQVMLCDLKMLEWKFEQAGQHCRQALEVNPNCLKARLRYSDLFLQSRNFAAALEQLEIIMTVDPLSAATYIHIARLYYLTGRYEEAISYLNDALELAHGSYEALALRGAVHIEKNDFEAALSDFQQSLEAQYHPEIFAMTGVVFAKQGRLAEARRVLHELEAQSDNNSGHSSRLAYIYLALGKKEQAYTALETACLRHEPDLRALTYDHRWLPIRNESRFNRLLKRIGLPNTRPTLNENASP
jgi:TolB-like protein/lipopolysaccharide biosynthesis regulator YciM